MKLLCGSRMFPFLMLGILTFGCNRSVSNSSSQETLSAAPAQQPALTIEASNSPAGVDSREPELSATADGRIILSWVEKVGDKRYALRFASRDKDNWSKASMISEGENWFVNWADFPSVIALTDGSLAAHWLVKSASSTYAYDVNIARSKDGGKTWGKPLPVSMTLRYAAIEADGNLSDEMELDERACECCQTSAALTSEGAIAVYRDRSDKEVRDIYTVSRQQGSWSVPRAVHADNWEINGCPVNGFSRWSARSGRLVYRSW